MKKSFTLIEVVVSLAIVVMVIGALVGLFSLSVRSYGSVDARLKAINLAREGIEQVRQIRDSAKLGSGGICFSVPPAALTPPANCVAINTSCDPPGLNHQTLGGGCGGAGPARGEIFTVNTSGVENNGIGILTSLNNTQFGRVMRMTDACADLGQPAGCDRLYSVAVTVYWRENNTTKNISLNTYLAKW